MPWCVHVASDMLRGDARGRSKASPARRRALADRCTKPAGLPPDQASVTGSVDDPLLEDRLPARVSVEGPAIGMPAGGFVRITGWLGREVAVRLGDGRTLIRRVGPGGFTPSRPQIRT